MKYKIFSFMFAPIILGAFSLSLVTDANGQADPPSVRLPPTQIATPTPTPQIQIPENPRERRALAYAKLMEGQRYMLMMRGASRGSAAILINNARNALQLAVTLEPKLAEGYTALAELAIQDNLDDSIKFAKKAIETDKNNYGSHLLLSRIYTVRSGINQRQLNKVYTELAIKELQEVVRLDKNNAEGWALLSDFYQLTGKKDEAIEALKNWADAPTPIDAQDGFYRNVTGSILTTDVASARLGEALIRYGKYDEAIAALSRAIYLNPEEEGYIELLIEAFSDNAESGSNAIAEIKRLVATNPTNIKLIKLLAETQSRAGKYAEAIETLKNGVARFEDDSDSNESFSIQLALGETYSNNFQEKEAIATYENILKQSGIETKSKIDEEERQNASIVFERIIASHKKSGNFKDTETAISRMRKVLGIDDSSADEEGVQLLRDQGKREDALKAIRLLRQKFPQRLNLAIREAEILTDLNRVDEGVAILNSKLSTTGTNQIAQASDIQLYLIISSLYSNSKRGKEAIDSAQKAAALVPQNGQRIMHSVLSILASAQETAGDFKAAETSLRRILNDKPNDANALNNLGYFLIERNERLEEALTMIQKAHRSDPTNSSFLDSLGWAYFKLGKFAEAEKYLTEAVKRNPFSATIQDHLGDVSQKLGKIEAARTAWQQALKLETDKDILTKIKAKLDSKTLSVK